MPLCQALGGGGAGALALTLQSSYWRAMKSEATQESPRTARVTCEQALGVVPVIFSLSSCSWTLSWPSSCAMMKAMMPVLPSYGGWMDRPRLPWKPAACVHFAISVPATAACWPCWEQHGTLTRAHAVTAPSRDGMGRMTVEGVLRLLFVEHPPYHSLQECSGVVEEQPCPPQRPHPKLPTHARSGSLQLDESTALDGAAAVP